jgi:hypothetical protein
LCPLKGGLDSLGRAALNANVGQNRHRWKESLDVNMYGVLDDAAARLGWAWKVDMRHPETYPLNTSCAFGEIGEWIREAQQGGLKRERKVTTGPTCVTSITDSNDLLR